MLCLGCGEPVDGVLCDACQSGPELARVPSPVQDTFPPGCLVCGSFQAAPAAHFPAFTVMRKKSHICIGCLRKYAAEEMVDIVFQPFKYGVDPFNGKKKS